MKTRLLIAILLLTANITNAQEQTIGLPSIINYSKQAYEAGKQNRCIGQDKRGLLYFANDDGLLVFDGTYWRTYTLPNKSIVRTLKVEDDRIYVGGQQEFGYFSFAKNGQLAYQSLKPLIPPTENEFTDVWNIERAGDDVFFRSNKRVFLYHNNQVTAFQSTNWSFLGKAKNKIIAQQFENGLVYFENGKWIPFHAPELFKSYGVAAKSTTDYQDGTTLITTLKAGFFLLENDSIRKYETPDMNIIAAQNVYSSCVLDAGQTVIATNLAGYYIINNEGKILRHITKQDGLQKNNLLYVFADKEKNLWVGLDNGIDLVLHDNAIRHIHPDNENKSPGYTAAVYNGQLYLGTSIGVYKAKLQNVNSLTTTTEPFSIVANSKGQVWGLSVVNDKLIICHNEGSYTIENNVAVKLDPSTGFWAFYPIGDQKPAKTVLAGTYNGVNLYTFENGRFINNRIHSNFESAKFIGISGNTIWSAHPYKGIYRVIIDKNGNLQNIPYNDKNKILSENHNHAFSIQNKIILTTDKGIFEYDESLSDFKPSPFFRAVFGNGTVSYLKEDASGNIWFIQDKKPGVIDVSNPTKPVINYIPELNNIVMSNGDEFIYPLNNHNILIAAEEGFYNVDYERYRENHHAVGIFFRTITAFNQRDSVLFGGYLVAGNNSYSENYTLEKNIGYKWNSVHFEFSSPLYGGVAEYSTRLKGFEKEWSAWSRKAEKGYTNLPAGNYVFEIKARDNLGNVSPVSTFTFVILPPWYRTLIAYFIYGLLIITVIYLFYKRQQKKYLLQQQVKLRKQQEKFQEEQKQLQYQHQVEIEKSEKEIIQLKNEKLLAEVEYKNTELASNTMNLLQKRELFSKIKEELGNLHLKDMPYAEKENKSIRKIIKMINDQLDINDDWDKFAGYFDKVNNDFLKNLKDAYPVLTVTDLKLCAYLRINLSSKEIASLLNISIRGVETSRYRLRKKLDIPNEITLFDFLVSIGGGQPPAAGKSPVEGESEEII